MLRYRYGRRNDMYCQHCQRSLLFDDPQNELKPTLPEGTRQYLQQYVNDTGNQLPIRQSTSWSDQENFASHESIFSDSGLSSSRLMSPTITSFISPSSSTLPTENISRALSPPQIKLQHHGSILLRAYSKQVHPQ